jgi:hypothetical protein
MNRGIDTFGRVPSRLNAVRIALVAGILVSHSFWDLGPLVLGVAAIAGSLLWWWITEGRQRAEQGTIYYDSRICPVVRYRHEWRPTGQKRRLGARSTPWLPVNNYVTGLRLTVGDRTIKVGGGLEPLSGLGKLCFGFDRSLRTDETTMTTGRLSFGFSADLRKSECVVLRRQTGNDSYYSLALRPADGDFEPLRSAVRMAGVQEG